MVYLLALSGLRGLENLLFDGLFLSLNLVVLVQVWRMDRETTQCPAATLFCSSLLRVGRDLSEKFDDDLKLQADQLEFLVDLMKFTGFFHGLPPRF
jgi:hypothetical protein